MKSYSNYKDSGVKWLGQIPQHWEVRRGRSFFSLINQRSISTTKIGLENIEGFTGKFIPTESTFEGDGVEVEEGDIVYGKLRPYLCKAWLATFGCNAVGDFFVFRCHNKSYNNYLHQVFLSPGFTDICNASTYGAKMPRVSSSFILSLPFPLPPLSEQLSIVSYLDVKVSGMDRLVLLTQQKVEHLKALKQAIIQEAVTTGIPNKNHILKQTNIKWIKQIPQHWEEIRLGRLFTENKKVNSDLACMEAYKFNYGSLVRKDLGIDPKELQDTYSKYTVLKDRDIVINGLNLNYDFVSVRVAQALQKGVITSAYLVLEPRKNICDKYYCWLLKAMDYMKLFHGMGSGIRLTLSYKDLKNQLLPLPPLSEQEEIVAYLDEKTAKIDLLIDKELQQIEHIKALKQTLIADVVTGKVDVTTKH